ncbi:MAG: hypothetical protein R2744_12715 [Bacteroidales bacterium]
MRRFRNKIFTYYFFVFILFTMAILVFQFNREREFRKSQLESLLDNISEMTSLYIAGNHLDISGDLGSIDSLAGIIPLKNTRITVITIDGRVVYDSYVDNYEALENHAGRPEIISALAHGKGSSIRTSSSTGKEYFYYARLFNGYIVFSLIYFRDNHFSG